MKLSEVVIVLSMENPGMTNGVILMLWMQLQSLQRRMHAALQEYYKLRGLYNKTELSRMEQESSENAVKVGDLQQDMDSALDTITDFLSSQLDGDTIRRLAMEKVERQEDREAATQAAGNMVRDGIPQPPPTQPQPHSAAVRLTSRVIRQATAVDMATRPPTATATLAHW